MNDNAVAGKINMLANEIQALHRGWNKLLYQYTGGNMLEKESEIEASFTQGLLKEKKETNNIVKIYLKCRFVVGTAFRPLLHFFCIVNNDHCIHFNFIYADSSLHDLNSCSILCVAQGPVVAVV